jgi:hypothetical protein
MIQKILTSKFERLKATSKKQIPQKILKTLFQLKNPGNSSKIAPDGLIKLQLFLISKETLY